MKKQQFGGIAIIFSMALCLLLLLVNVPKSFVNTDRDNSGGTNNEEQEQQIQGWVTTGVAFVTFLAVAFQAFTNHKQRVVMDRQLKAAETAAHAAEIAADAALAALDRPWLVVEVLGHNELDWMEGKAPLIVEFQIVNYGKAPAFIKSMKFLHFRSFNPRIGTPPDGFRGKFADFPEPDRFFHFLYSRWQIPCIRGNDPSPEIKWPLPRKPSEFVLGGGGKTEVLCLIGHGQLEGENTVGIDPVHLTKSYFIGSIFHEFPGRRAETLTFCFHRDEFMRHFDLFRDYAPYNGRKDEKGAQ